MIEILKIPKFFRSVVMIFIIAIIPVRKKIIFIIIIINIIIIAINSCRILFDNIFFTRQNSRVTLLLITRYFIKNLDIYVNKNLLFS